MSPGRGPGGAARRPASDGRHDAGGHNAGEPGADGRPGRRPAGPGPGAAPGPGDDRGRQRRHEHRCADERARILTKLEEAGTGPAERAFVEREMNAPLSIDDLAREVSGPDVAAQVYAAALAAIDVDKATERRFLQALAQRLGLDAEIVNEIHDQLGQPRPA